MNVWIFLLLQLVSLNLKLSVQGLEFKLRYQQSLEYCAASG